MDLTNFFPNDFFLFKATFYTLPATRIGQSVSDHLLLGRILRRKCPILFCFTVEPASCLLNLWLFGILRVRQTRDSGLSVAALLYLA